MILNILNNSIQTVTATNVSQAERTICVKKRGGADGEVIITVSDNGPGVPESMRPDLFELLTTSKNTGMGLGLWLYRHIVKQNNGTITYGVSKRGGAQFIIAFSLPARP